MNDCTEHLRGKKVAMLDKHAGRRFSLQSLRTPKFNLQCVSSPNRQGKQQILTHGSGVGTAALNSWLLIRVRQVHILWLEPPLESLLRALWESNATPGHLHVPFLGHKGFLSST